MSILNNSLLLGADAGAAGYQISRSLRFNSSDSAYLSQSASRSPAANTSITFSFWLKLSDLSTDQQIIWSHPAAGYLTIAYYGGYQNGGLWVTNDSSGADDNSAKSNGVLRDPSAWYHVLYSRAHGSNGILYINGVQQTTQAINTANIDFFADSSRAIGRRSDNNSRYASYYLADFYCIDGQALTPSSFTEVSATTGQLIPKAYTGSFGTNGFWLKFSDNSAATATTLGKDYSGNSNNWTPNNLSVTAGSGNDSLVDTPTSYGTDTGVGGQVRGNYATWNPLDQGTVTLTNGNLDASATVDNNVKGTIAIPESVKIYFEFTVTQRGGGGAQSPIVGICTPELLDNVNIAGYTSLVWCYSAEGTKVGGGASYTSYGNSLAANDVLGVAIDRANGRIWFSKNGTWQNSGTPTNGSDANAAFTNVPTTGTIHIVYGNNNTIPGTGVLNAGQRPFVYTAPSGFKALCDTNLPAPVVAKPSTVMDVALYAGTGSSLTATSALGFSPDLVWIKGRSGATDHALYDAVRGATLDLVSNSTAAETTQTQGLTAFNSNGFSVGTLAKVNTSSATYVAWTWDAGSSTVTNTQGSITSSVRANASAGFSIVTYTGNATTGATVGHGLGVAPGFVIIKDKSAAFDWRVWTTSFGTGNALSLNSTAATSGNSPVMQAAPNSTVMSLLGSGYSVNNSGNTYVAYCFAPVASYSAFGSYTGNGTSDGPFVYTGFRPRWVIIKRSDAAGSWGILDTVRNTFNVSDKLLWTNLSDAEGTYTILDVLSNGFKLRESTNGYNTSSGTYIYAAFAENPFQYARAR